MFKDIFTEGASTTRTIRNIRKTAAYALEEKYSISEKDAVDILLATHGMDIDNFDIIKNIDKAISSRINDISIDDNANKHEKSVSSTMAEVLAPYEKAAGYDYLYRMMVHMYGKKESKRLSAELYDYSLGLSDATKTLVPYCFAIDASKIVTLGRPFGQLHSKPPKRLDSYISCLCETIHQLSSHLAGAIAISTFFLDVSHMLIYKEEITLKDLKENQNTRKKIENELQKFVHSVNHLSRASRESPFTNISIFDKPRLLTLLSHEHMGWYFDGVIDYNKNNEVDKENTAYTVEYIMEVQRIFMNFFDKGDPLSGDAPYRFPIVTTNITKTTDKDGKCSIVDNAFVDEMCNREIDKYNIFCSEGTKIASCCRLINDTEMMNVAAQANSFGGGASISIGSHRVVTINLNRIALESNSMASVYALLDDRIKAAGMILKAHKECMIKLTDAGVQPFIKNGWLPLNRMFSTFGILGIVECEKTMMSKIRIRKTIIPSILEHINQRVADISKKLGILGNIEQIPAESMAHRFAAIDQMIFGEDKVPYQLYSNQFVPLWEECSIWDRLKIDGKYNKLITGGGIVHAQVGEKVTPQQAKQIIAFAVENGCEHFALNMIYSKCEQEHVSRGKHGTCPVCGAKIVDYITRVVGFFTKVSSWGPIRRDWEFQRRTFVKVEK